MGGSTVNVSQPPHRRLPHLARATAACKMLVLLLGVAVMVVNGTPADLPSLHSAIAADLEIFWRNAAKLPQLELVGPLLSAKAFGRFDHSLQCLQPVDKHLALQQFDSSLAKLALKPGRVLSDILPEGCGLHSVDGVVSATEASTLIDHGRTVFDRQPSPKKGEKPSNVNRVDFSRSIIYGTREGHLLYIRLLERVRRIVASDLGIKLKRLKLSGGFVSKFDSSYSDTHYHCDESSYPTYHFSAVLYLNTIRQDFSGGTLTFARSDSTPLEVEPLAGRLVYFSSGWENQHKVNTVKAGERWSMPLFFEVSPSTAQVQQKAFQDNCVQPQTNAALAKCSPDWAQLFEADSHGTPFSL